MKKSSLIGHVVELYSEVSSSSKPADHCIDIFFRKRKYLGSTDRRFIAETLYGILRHQKRIEWLLSISQSKKTPLHFCIAYLLFENKETLESLRDEISLTAEELSRIDQHTADEPQCPTEIETLATKYSFQEWMIGEWKNSIGSDTLNVFCERLNTQAPMTIRVNTLKISLEDCQNELLKAGIETEKTLYSPFGLHLKKRINLFQLEAFKNGLVEVQDEGSQLLALLVDPKPRAKVIDACAGAGGKSLAIASLMKNRGEIFALDIHAFRLDDLRKRAKRDGVDIIRIKSIRENQLIDELIGRADTVLVDAPCSGTGTIRRNPGMKWSVSPTMISEMHEKQISILSLNSRYVKVNGRLIYSTCSTMKHENEEVVEKFLASNPNFEIIPPSTILGRYQLTGIGGDKYFQLYPHIHNTDGFFAAAMKRIS